MSEPDDPLDEAFAAYLRSCDEGSHEDREAFVQRYPELSDRLRDLMVLADSMGSFVATDSKPDSRSAERSPTRDSQQANVSVDADTLDFEADSAEVNERNVTLPMAHRQPGDPGPTLPFELGDYTLQQIIGRGGMGIVYLAIQKNLDRKVAVKMIRSGAFASETEVARFYMEAKAAAALEHPNIVSIYQFGHLSGHHYFSMELVPGTDMARKIKDSPLQPVEAARYVRDVAYAIHHAHQRGVLHRDLKPANVLIDLNDQVRVTDFGLAKQIDSDSSVTGSGAAIGTPSYMAPEQAAGHSDRVGVECDVYSLGAILFAAVAGRPPFTGNSAMQTLLNVIHQSPPLLRSLCPQVDRDIETIVNKCLEKSPNKRYRSALSLANDLNCYLEGDAIEARPRSGMWRAIHWLQRVPLVAAIMGRRVIDTTDSHRRFQTIVLAMSVLIPFIFLAALSGYESIRQRMPADVRIAGGLEGGAYSDLSAELCERIKVSNDIEVETIPSGGSFDNRKRLLAGEVDLAPMQAITVTGNELCIVAPLFYEAVHVLVRTDSKIETLEQIAGHKVAVGLANSGSRVASEMVLQSLNIDERQSPRIEMAWSELLDPHSTGDQNFPDVALVCIGKGSRLGTSMLDSGQWRLLPLPSAVDISLAHPSLRPMKIMPVDYPQAGLPEGGISTVGMTAYLVATSSTPDTLVSEVLEALYAEPAIATNLIPKELVGEWQGLLFHRAARQFFEL